jgi:Peptidase C39 family
MVLAAFGREVEESTLEDQAHLEPGGTEISELARLARRFGLVARVQEVPVEQLSQSLAEGKFAIAYIDRVVFDLTPRQRKEHRLRNARIHTVIPTRITTTAVVYHDPMPPARTRRSIRLFRSAYERLGSHCVVCSKPDES